MFNACVHFFRQKIKQILFKQSLEAKRQLQLLGKVDEINFLKVFLVFNFLATSFLEALYRLKEKHVKVKHKHRQLISERKVLFDIPGFKRSNRRLKFQIYLYLSLKDPIEFRVMKHSVAVYKHVSF